MPAVASLFSGAGGLDWGFRVAGYRVVLANDVHPPACRTYSANFGMPVSGCSGWGLGEVVCCDVSLLDLRELRGLVDVLLGGPPCQDFSVARGPEWERVGVSSARGSLYTFFARALAVVEPVAFVFENVPGLVSANGGLAYASVVGALTRPGSVAGGGSAEYELLFSGVVDFSAVGVPQRRRRLIVVGVRKGYLVGSGLERARDMIARALARAPFDRFPLTAMEVFEGRVLPDLRERYREVMMEWRGVWDDVGTERARRWKKEVWDKMTLDAVEDYLALNGAVGIDEGELDWVWREHRRVLEELGYYGRRVCSEPSPDGSCEPPNLSQRVAERLRLVPPGENIGFLEGTHLWTKSVVSLYYRRLHPLKPAYTVVARGGGGTHGYHYERSRATLSNRERARLQTFPDGFLFPVRRSDARALIGDAVPPLPARRLAEALRNLVEGVV